MTQYKTLDQVKALLNSFPFDDYPNFEDVATARNLAKVAFMADEVYVPHYSYPKLDELYTRVNEDDGLTLQERKTKIYEAVLELNAHKESGLMPPELIELYASFHELRLKKIMLVEASKNLYEARGSAEIETARRTFMKLNQEIYGDMNEPAFSAIMATESRRVETFTPQDDRSTAIQSELLDYFRQHEFSGEEQGTLTDEEIAIYRHAFKERYGHILDVVPETPEDHYYDADECAVILNDCLAASGLAAKGWICEVDPKKV